jgi:FHS family glucose/mannose:H+ symporter-like MFS transporter
MVRMTQDAPAAGTFPDRTAPSLGLMHFGFLLTGLGTMLLGPILPLLARRWHLDDAQSGQLLLAQFCGSFLGGVSVSSRLRRDLLVGLAAAGIGLLGFANAPGLAWACAAMALGGAGIGRTITAINIVAGRRFTVNRGSALMRLNFTWSFGAMLSPLLAAWLAPRYALDGLLDGFAGLFLVAAIALLVQARGLGNEPAFSNSSETHRLSGRVFLYFGALMILYGGLETCLNGWLTTFALRYGHPTQATSALASSEYTMVLMLLGLTLGRAVASLLLLKMRDATLQRIGLALAAAFTIALAKAGSSEAIALFALLLGLSLAPVFPATFSLIMAARPTARQAGVIMAASGLGAAALPWLMGVVSTHTGSLQIALTLPFAAAAIMLGLSLLPAREDAAVVSS